MTHETTAGVEPLDDLPPAEDIPTVALEDLEDVEAKLDVHKGVPAAGDEGDEGS